MNPLDTDIKYLKGVGPAKAKILGNELGIHTLRDLLYHLPYKYIDRSVIQRVCDLADGMSFVQLRGRVVSAVIEDSGRRERLVATFTDGTGYIELVWFNGIHRLQKELRSDTLYLLLGKPTNFNGRLNITHPELEDAARYAERPVTMQAHYHLTEKMKRQFFTSRTISELVSRTFAILDQRSVPETLPPYFVQKYGLLSLDRSLRTLHAPASSAALPEAVRRMKFEELFFLQLDILRYARERQNGSAGFRFPKVGTLFHTFYRERLPFNLTEAQKRVMREIRADLATGQQMNRLLQGDVGSGKTMVALLTCLLALDNNYQACVMAPTEILAEQHYASMAEYLDGMPVGVALLTGNVKGRARREVLEGIANGNIRLLIGTHALIQPNVSFLNLGMVVIDEQHRFGVEQRAKLWQKNIIPPHVLVMTATPIPRTLAMTVYGDLDVSVIDELPPGRRPVQTLHYYRHNRAKLYQGMAAQLKEGRQIYVVYPLIKENEKQDLLDLQTGFQTMADTFPDYKVAMLHGKMKPAEKEAAMMAFKRGETRLLVSTTVIEVGVNVPNASVMVIENAERFGLSQLHQLRGRVGRGAAQSYCILMTKEQLAPPTLRRMEVMTTSTDGFYIAEEDMKLRGPGDLEGTAQSGIPFDLKIASLTKDADLMEEARIAASDILSADPERKLPCNEPIWTNLRRLKKTMTNFSEIS